MRSSHGRAVYTFALCSTASAAAIWSAVDASDFSISAVLR
jgi:hypothetical protein